MAAKNYTGINVRTFNPFVSLKERYGAFKSPENRNELMQQVIFQEKALGCV